MGNSFLGMNIEGVNQVAGSIEAQAVRIRGILKTLTATLESTPWIGADRDRFVQEWVSTHAPAIQKAAADMEQASGQVRASIKLQVQASGH